MKDSAFEAQVLSTAQQWIIGITVFAIIAILLFTIISYCIYSATEKPKKAYKIIIIVISAIIIMTLIIFAIIAINSIK